MVLTFGEGISWVEGKLPIFSHNSLANSFCGHRKSLCRSERRGGNFSVKFILRTDKIAPRGSDGATGVGALKSARLPFLRSKRVEEMFVIFRRPR